MKLKNQVLIVAGLAFFASCGSNSTDKETKNDIVVVTEPVTNPVIVEVPATTKTTFETKYPQASNVRWEYYRPDFSSIDWEWTGWPRMDTTDHMARFNWDGSDYWAWYDEQGNWIGTVNMINDYAMLPAPINSTIGSQYNGYTIVSANRENDKDRTAYEISLEKGSNKMKLLIDENGKILKKKMMTEDSKTKEKMNPKDSVM